jgi:hypothetical protein
MRFPQQIYQGKKRDSDNPDISWKAEQFYWTELLGEGIFRINGRTERRNDQAGYPGTGRREQTAGPPQNVQRELSAKAAFRRFQNQLRGIWLQNIT